MDGDTSWATATPVEFCLGVWVVTPYRRCSYACTYCCTYVQGRSQPLVTAERAWTATEEAIAKGGDIFWCVGGFSDAYPPEEAEHGITRGIVERLVAADQRFTIVTKSTLVERDADVLRRAARGWVTVSMSAVASAQLDRMEGIAPSVTERVALLHRLHATGVRCEINVLPFVPGVTDLGEILAVVPADVPLTVSPLLFGEDRDEARFGGVLYVRSLVWDAYLEAYERYGHVARIQWVRPSLPPNENNPYGRLPLLSGPLSERSALRRSLVAEARARERARSVAAPSAERAP